jgi:hypothetical protein
MGQDIFDPAICNPCLLCFALGLKSDLLLIAIEVFILLCLWFWVMRKLIGYFLIRFGLLLTSKANVAISPGCYSYVKIDKTTLAETIAEIFLIFYYFSFLLSTHYISDIALIYCCSKHKFKVLKS